MLLDYFLVIYIFPLSTSFPATYNGQFYDLHNHTYAECVVVGDHYIYYGDKNVTYDDKECINWSDALDGMKEQLHDLESYYFAQEHEEHNYCRTLNLGAYRPTEGVSKAVGHVFIDSFNWDKRPWCYVGNPTGVKAWANQFQFRFEPYPCFKPCRGQAKLLVETQITTTTPKPKPFHRYNVELIDQLTDHLFDSIEFGDIDKYFDPNRGERENEDQNFKFRRQQLLYIFNGLLVITLILLLLRRGKEIYDNYRNTNINKINKEAKKNKEIDPDPQLEDDLKTAIDLEELSLNTAVHYITDNVKNNPDTNLGQPNNGTAFYTDGANIGVGQHESYLNPVSHGIVVPPSANNNIVAAQTIRGNDANVGETPNIGNVHEIEVKKE